MLKWRQIDGNTLQRVKNKIMHLFLVKKAQKDELKDKNFSKPFEFTDFWVFLKQQIRKNDSLESGKEDSEVIFLFQL